MKAGSNQNIDPRIMFVFLIPLISIMVSGVFFYHCSKEYNTSKAEYISIKEDYAQGVTKAITVLETPQRQSVQIESPDPLQEEEIVDFYSLKQINEDVVGWITVPVCGINYPVVQGHDNENYLTRTYKGTENFAGAIFIDAENSADFSDLHTLIYGHNMKNNSMFGSLKKIRNDASVVNDSPYVYIFTPDGRIRRYQIFATRIVADDSEAYRFFTGDKYYDEFVEECLTNTRPGIEQNIDFSYRMPIITLSTCSGDDERFLVHCVLTDIY